MTPDERAFYAYRFGWLALGLLAIVTGWAWSLNLNPISAYMLISGGYYLRRFSE